MTDVDLLDLLRAPYQEEMEDALDITLWTKENRNEKLEKIGKINDGIADRALEISNKLPSLEIQGKPAYYWKVRTEWLDSEIEFLKSIRDDMDMVTDEEMSQIPFDYEWINQAIRKRIQERFTIGNFFNDALVEALRDEAPVEAI